MPSLPESTPGVPPTKVPFAKTVELPSDTTMDARFVEAGKGMRTVAKAFVGTVASM